MGVLPTHSAVARTRMNADFQLLIQWFTKQLDTGFKLNQNFPSAPSVKQDHSRQITSQKLTPV